jgi:hypothetical protein
MSAAGFNLAQVPKPCLEQQEYGRVPIRIDALCADMAATASNKHKRSWARFGLAALLHGSAPLSSAATLSCAVILQILHALPASARTEWAALLLKVGKRCLGYCGTALVEPLTPTAVLRCTLRANVGAQLL